MINILFVEDNPGFRHLFKEMLNESSLEFNLVEAINPLQGLELYIKNNCNFDYVICDFFLPIQNGDDFLEVVKSHNKSVICVLISADESVENKKFPHVDKFFAKSDAHLLIQFLSRRVVLKP